MAIVELDQVKHGQIKFPDTEVAVAPGAARPGVAGALERLQANIAGVILGKDEVIQMVLVALLAEGHLLLEDVPGVGKTTLAKALARSLDCTFHRIQFTPDLLPSDLIGTSIFHQNTSEFVFKPGPIFSQIVLADEINRSTPRTQSALLEAMSERQVSVDGETRPLGPPFMVVGTQNPYEFKGTYPLPESQLDRFLMRLKVGYPAPEAEKGVLTGHRVREPVDHIGPVLGAFDVLSLQDAVRQVSVNNSLLEYILAIVNATRSHPGIYLGASTRAALALYRAVQALAMVKGRYYVIPDDIKRLVKPVLGHRIIAKSVRQGGRSDTAETILGTILEQVPIPR